MNDNQKKILDEYIKAISSFIPSIDQKAFIEKHHDEILNNEEMNRYVEAKLYEKQAQEILKDLKGSIEVVHEPVGRFVMNKLDSLQSLSSYQLSTAPLVLSRGNESDKLSQVLHIYFDHQDVIITSLERFPIILKIEESSKKPDEIIDDPSTGQFFYIFKDIPNDKTIYILIND